MRRGSRRAVTALALGMAATVGGGTAAVAVARSGAGAGPAAAKFSERFDGRSANGSYIASVFVSASPHKSRFDVGFRQGGCSDGAHYSSEVLPLRGQGFTAPASGPASFSGYYAHAYTLNRHGKVVQGHERFRVTMQFSGSSVSGVVTDRFTSRHLRCHSGQVHFTAWRDGTPQAPFDTSWGSTGHYAGKSDYGDAMGMTVFVPLGLVTRLTVTFPKGLFCSGGLVYPHPKWIFRNLRINGGRFRFSGHDAWRKGGFRYTDHFSISAGSLRVVRWDYVVKSYRGARQLGTCRTAQFGGDVFDLKPPRGHKV